MRPALIITLLFTAFLSRAQSSLYTAFTVNDGLPSNNVYKCVEDDKGFLWIATDAGLARFDGKHFRVFTTRDGLPDNEVLEVIKENNGRIWANCFKQSPAYFDEVKNRFINSNEDKMLKLIPQGNNVLYSFVLADGGVMFSNIDSYIIKDRHFTKYGRGEKDDNFLISKNPDGSLTTIGGYYDAKTAKSQIIIYRKRNGVYTDSVKIMSAAKSDLFVSAIDEKNFYMFNRVTGDCYAYSNITNNGLKFKVDTIKAPDAFSSFGFTSDSFYLVCYSGKVIFYNKKTFKHSYDVSGEYLPNSAYKDHNGNLWICTIDKGLLFYRQSSIKTVELPPAVKSSNFLSVTCKPDGTILSGSFYGEVVEVQKNNAVIHIVPHQNIIARQRKIVTIGKKVFTISESGSYINYKTPILNDASGAPVYGKTALAYNDSILLIGMTTGLVKFNINTGVKIVLNTSRKRTTSLARNAAGMVYFGSTDGLHKYNYFTNITSHLNESDPILGERITGICATPDDLVWVATSGQGIAVLKDDKLLLKLSELNGVVSNATRCIISGKPGEIWLGTSNGISRVNYTVTGKGLRYSITNINSTDGLTDNTINELCWRKDTVYAATANGISVIPANISINPYNIPVQLVGISINQLDTTLAKSYQLKRWQQSIELQFAGIELGGHFKNLQYSLDKNQNWLNLNEYTLLLQLNSGNHVLDVRAVDVNGNTTSEVLTLRFNIDTPFWKLVWFWIVSAVIVQIILIYFISNHQKKKKEARLAKQIATVQTAALEQQAFTSLMNPHFMFNALNSIQHYINVQDRQNTNRYLSDFASLIRKNFEAAQQSFIPLEEELENIKIYLRLEEMRFSDKFIYQFEISAEVDTEDWMIPTMILQPLLENALLHGIMPSSIKGQLLISICIKNTDLLICITDNGIGIANSLALKENSRHRSRGTELIKKRITALGRVGSQPITIAMLPASDDEKNPGNKTILSIPPGLHTAWLKAQQQ